ncbi:MAG TPA: MliC family protein [Allosphingosinicella sp.]|jgi:membrane-bound inhibitor of C-type lysozyme
MRAQLGLAAAALLAACGHLAETPDGPAGLAYACADGRTAIVRYDGGDPNRVPARLSIGGVEMPMVPDPAASGLRYRSEAGLEPGHALVWASQGDDAALIEIAPAGEREIVRCRRVREDSDALLLPDAEHGARH